MMLNLNVLKLLGVNQFEVFQDDGFRVLGCMASMGALIMPTLKKTPDGNLEPSVDGYCEVCSLALCLQELC